MHIVRTWYRYMLSYAIARNRNIQIRLEILQYDGPYLYRELVVIDMVISWSICLISAAVGGEVYYYGHLVLQFVENSFVNLACY